MTENNTSKYLRLIKNTTLLSKDIGFSPINKQSPKQISDLLNLNKIAVLDIKATGFESNLDSIISVTMQKFDLSENWTKQFSEPVQLFVSPASQHPEINVSDSDLLPDKIIDYLNTDKKTILDSMISINCAKKEIKQFISNCQSVVIYRNSEQRFLYSMFPKKIWDVKINLPIFKLQTFYKDLDKGLISWQYSINSLLYRLKIGLKVEDNKDKVRLMGLAIYKMQRIFQYLDLNQSTKMAKDYDKLRPTIKGVSFRGNGVNDSVISELKNRKEKKTYQFSVINKSQDQIMHAIAGDDNGVPVDLSDEQNQIDQRELLIKLNAQSFYQVFNELLDF